MVISTEGFHTFEESRLQYKGLPGPRVAIIVLRRKSQARPARALRSVSGPVDEFLARYTGFSAGEAPAAVVDCGVPSLFSVGVCRLEAIGGVLLELINAGEVIDF